MTAWVKNLLVIVVKSIIYGLLYALGFKHTGSTDSVTDGDSDLGVTPLEKSTETTEDTTQQ